MFNAEKFANDARDAMTKAKVKVKQSLLRQLLDNGDISTEVYSKEVSNLLDELLLSQGAATEKPQDTDPNTITVNGFKVPKPMSEKPAIGYKYYEPDLDGENLYVRITWTGDSFDNHCFSRNICHTTKDAAAAHAKAMLGIDPWSDK